jgi:hypothetical protein
LRRDDLADDREAIAASKMVQSPPCSRSANLGRREGGSVYEATPTIDFILGADDHLIGIAIHGDKALGLLDLLHQIIDGHGLVSIGGLSDRALAPV